MTLLLGRLGLYPVPLCVLPYRHLNHSGVTHSELCRNRVHQCATGSRESRRHSSRFGFFCHSPRVHCLAFHTQDMSFVGVVWLQKVIQECTIDVHNNSCAGLVAGLRTIIGLSFRGQRPAPGESLRPLFGGFNLGAA